MTAVTSFDQKSPGSGCRKPKTCVLGVFDFLQGCSSQEEAVTLQEMTSRDHVTGIDPEVTSFDRKSPGGGCRRQKTRIFGAFNFRQHCRLHKEAVT